MPKPKPIPVNCFTNGAGRAASAFLVTDGSSVWLVTVAHIVTGQRVSLGSDPRFNSAVIEVLEPAIQLSLTVNGAMRAKHVYKGLDAGKIFDVMSIKLARQEAEKLKSYGMFDLDKIVDVAVGDKVTFTGFPGLQTLLIPESKEKAQVEIAEGVSLQFSKPSRKGYSGGPVFNKSGLIGVVYGDASDQPILKNGLAYRFTMLKSVLFD